MPPCCTAAQEKMWGGAAPRISRQPVPKWSPHFCFQGTMPQPVLSLRTRQAWGQQVELREDSNDDDNVDDDGDNCNKTADMMMGSPINLFKLAKQSLTLGKVGGEAGIFW